MICRCTTGRLTWWFEIDLNCLLVIFSSQFVYYCRPLTQFWWWEKYTRSLSSFVVVHLGSRGGALVLLYFVPCHKPCPSIRPRGSSLFVAAWKKSSHPRISQWVNTDMLRVSLIVLGYHFNLTNLITQQVLHVPLFNVHGNNSDQFPSNHRYWCLVQC